MSHISHVALTLSLALGAAAARNSIVASKGAETLAVGIFGALIHHSYTYLRIQSSLSDKNDCDPGDRQDISNPTIEESDAFDDQAGVDFKRLFAPLIDDRWCFGHDHLP
ncbi:purple acid phosphatase 3 [Penicillium atrosanguineum]|nr:purple acid phosphatase 3 [Penicillium atrosanguineum]